MPDPEVSTRIRAQLQTDDPLSPGNALGTLAQAWADWRLRLAAEQADDPMAMPLMTGAVTPVGRFAVTAMGGKGPTMAQLFDLVRARVPSLLTRHDRPGGASFPARAAVPPEGGASSLGETAISTTRGAKDLTVRPDLTPGEAFATLVHELFHAREMTKSPEAVARLVTRMRKADRTLSLEPPDEVYAKFMTSRALRGLPTHAAGSWRDLDLPTYRYLVDLRRGVPPSQARPR